MTNQPGPSGPSFKKENQMKALTEKQFNLLTVCITCYKSQIEEDIFKFRKFDQTDEVIDQINRMQTEYFDLEELWKLCYDKEKEARREALSK